MSLSKTPAILNASEDTA